jgi:hypothetical protein
MSFNDDDDDEGQQPQHSTDQSSNSLHISSIRHPAFIKEPKYAMAISSTGTLCYTIYPDWYPQLHNISLLVSSVTQYILTGTLTYNIPPYIYPKLHNTFLLVKLSHFYMTFKDRNYCHLFFTYFG